MCLPILKDLTFETVLGLPKSIPFVQFSLGAEGWVVVPLCQAKAAN